MLEIVDTQKIKKKFGTLLSKLHTDNKLSNEEIEEVIINNDYFDFLEKQNPKSFLDDSYERIAKKIFNCETVFSEEMLSEYYWSGTMYMSICLNKRIPLKQIVLLCPLSKMLGYYDVYHEMSESQLINKFIEDDYKTSILKLIRKKRNMTVKELSLACNIPLLTIKYYEKNNDSLFKASFENISKLVFFLNCSETLFLRYSRYTPFSYILFEDKEILTKISKKIDCFYNSEAMYEFDGILLKRILDNKIEYVPEPYLISAILQALQEYSESNTLIY